MAELNTTLLNKEVIAARMFRHAARYWGYKDTDIDNFDPLVRLLIEACAVELYRIGNEINSVQERMLEKLARLLTPEVHTAPKPAHAVLHARSLEPETRVHPSMQFFYHKKVASKPNGPLDSNLDVFFSPAGNYKAIDGDIKLIAAGSHLYAINEWNYKETFLNTRTGKKFDPRTIWLGLELNTTIADISALSFFFDLKNHPGKRQLFPLLHYSKWSINNTPIDTHEGLWDAATNTPSFEAFTGFDEFSINQSVERHINYFYKQQFITIQQTGGFKFKTERYPPGFEKILTANDLPQLQKELLWVRVSFLAEFDEIVLDDLSVSINCFPVLNRHLNETRYRLQSNFNIIPLLTPEQFLSVHDVQGTEGGDEDTNKYANSPLDAAELKIKGTYSLRTGDVERFDSRNATEYMNYLLELLRDESRAFAALGQDFVASLIKELNQNIAQIEQKVKLNIALLNQVPTYMLLNPRTDGENIFVEYWSTNGEAANLIRSGSRLELYQGGDLVRESLTLMTNTTGGSDKLKNTEVLNAYKNTLVTRGRIVTLEDIKSYCSMALNGKAKNISIKKGVGISPLPNQGLINTVDIRIEHMPAYNDAEEWQGILQDLKTRLEEQSAVWSNYRINVEL
ncbi:MAG TPA: type VI secretion system baseplate subunit TssF [Panacibacter sp.]|nr:type VI secretion system baseplate subunit TssF [Panacibacter sp.]